MTELEQYLQQALQEKQQKILPENIKKDITIFGVEGTLEPEPILEELTAEENGEYLPEEGTDGFSKVIVNVENTSIEQKMPFYMIETDDAGNLYCVNNYDSMAFIPYSIDEDGNLIVTKDDNDVAEYNIIDNELEVTI